MRLPLPMTVLVQLLCARIPDQFSTIASLVLLVILVLPPLLGALAGGQ